MNWYLFEESVWSFAWCNKSLYIYTIFLVSVCIMYRWLDRFRFRFKRYIQGNDTHWQVTPCLQLCAVHVCRSKAIESTAPIVELNSIRLRTLVVSILAVSGYLILILANNLYFLKTWFNFELPEISCSGIKAPWVLRIRHLRFALDTNAHHTQGSMIIKHTETQLL